MKREEIIEFIVSQSAEITWQQAYEIDINKSFYESGIDSLDFVEVIMKCETQWNIAIPDEQSADFNTLSDLIDYLEKKLNKQI